MTSSENEVEKWLSDIVASIKGSIPADKVNIVKKLLEDDGIFEKSDILLIKEKLTKDSLVSNGVPAAFAKRIETAVQKLEEKVEEKVENVEVNDQEEEDKVESPSPREGAHFINEGKLIIGNDFIQNQYIIQGKGPLTPEIMNLVESRLREFYKSKGEAMIQLDVGETIRQLCVDELFVNLAIVEEETQRIQERRELESENRALRQHHSSRPHDTHGSGATSKGGGIGFGSMMTTLGIMTSIRNDDNDLKIQHDSEGIGSRKTEVKPDDLFKEHMLFNKKRVRPFEVLLLGRAGIGKTTLCRYLAFRWASGNMWTKDTELGYRWVFYLRLKEVANNPNLKDETGIQNIFYEMLLKRCGVHKDRCEDVWDECLKEASRVLFILDGYDEVAEQNHLACETLMTVRDSPSCSNIRVLTTSRPHASVRKTVDVVFENIGFIDDDIPRYIEKYFHWNTPDGAIEDTKWTELHPWLKGKPKIHQICKVPINLELLCSLWTEKRKQLEEEDLVMSDLYQLMLCKLMRRFLQKALPITEWNEVKAAADFQHAVMNHQNSLDALRFLQLLALEGFKSGNLILSVAIFQKLGKIYGDSFKNSIKHFLNAGFLKAVGEIQADSNHKEYYFIHLSFQEFLIARYYAGHILNNTLSKDDAFFFQENKFNPRYVLPWVYTAGSIRTYEIVPLNEDENAKYVRISGGLSRYFKLLLSKPRDLYGVYELELLVRCGEESKWHDIPVTRALLRYLGRWVMEIGSLLKGQDRDHLLRHLNQMFLTCPMTMEKVEHSHFRWDKFEYSNKKQLFNFLTYEQLMPGWIQWLADTTEWMNGGGFGCWAWAYIPLYNRLTENCECPSCPDCQDVCEYCPTCCYTCLEMSISTVDRCTDCFKENFFAKLIGGIICCGPAVAGGFSMFILCFCFGVLWVLFGFFPLVLVIFFTGIIPGLYANLYAYKKYRDLQTATAAFLGSFHFSDMHLVKRLMKLLIRTEDADTAVRLIDSYDASNFAVEVHQPVRDTLHQLILSHNGIVQRSALRRWLQFKTETELQIAHHEGLLAFNSTMFEACFGENAARRSDTVSFITEVFPESVANSAITVISMVTNECIVYLQQQKRLNFASRAHHGYVSWLQDINFSSTATKQAMRAHFCLFCLNILSGKHKGRFMGLERELFYLVTWQRDVVARPDSLRPAYSRIIGYFPPILPESGYTTHQTREIPNEIFVPLARPGLTIVGGSKLGTWKVVGEVGANLVEGESVESKLIRILPTDTIVTVVKVVGRRARLDAPHEGWVSLYSIDGYIIMSQLESNDSPAGTGDENENVVDSGGDSDTDTTNKNLANMATTEQVTVADALRRATGWFSSDAEKIESIITDQNVQNLQRCVDKSYQLNEKTGQNNTLIQSIEHFLNDIECWYKIANRDSQAQILRQLEESKEKQKVSDMKRELVDQCLGGLVKTYLSVAFWLGIQRDLWIILMPFMFFYAPPFVYLVLFNGYRAWITIIFVGSVIVIETIWFFLFRPFLGGKCDFDFKSDENSFLGSLCKTPFSKTFVGFFFFFFYFFCFMLIAFTIGFPSLFIDDQFMDVIGKYFEPKSFFSKITAKLAVISEIEVELRKAEYFRQVLSNYPGYLFGSNFNSRDAFTGMLRRHLAPHHRALWQKDDGSFFWYQGLSPVKISAFNSMKLKADVKSIRLLKDFFESPLFGSCVTCSSDIESEKDYSLNLLNADREFHKVLIDEGLHYFETVSGSRESSVDSSKELGNQLVQSRTNSDRVNDPINSYNMHRV